MPQSHVVDDGVRESQQVFNVGERVVILLGTVREGTHKPVACGSNIDGFIRENGR
jgi:hypothetical protein